MKLRQKWGEGREGGQGFQKELSISLRSFFLSSFARIMGARYVCGRCESCGWTLPFHSSSFLLSLIPIFASKGEVKVQQSLLRPSKAAWENLWHWSFLLFRSSSSSSVLNDASLLQERHFQNIVSLENKKHDSSFIALAKCNTRQKIVNFVPLSCKDTNTHNTDTGYGRKISTQIISFFVERFRHM